MKIEINKQNRIMSVWFSNEEKNSSLPAKLRHQYSYYIEQGYLVVEYYSGKQELLECTRNLLVHNIHNKFKANICS